MPVDEMNKTNDDLLNPEEAVEGKGGLQPEFDESSNKIFMQASKAADTASGVLPDMTIVFSDGDSPEDKPSTPTAGEDKQGEKTETKPEPAADKNDKVTVNVKLGNAEIPVSLKPGQEYTIGRGKDGIPNNSPVSREHAVIGLDEKGVYVKDLKSTNGTYVFRGGSNQGEKALPGEKIYLHEVTGVQFSANGPKIEGGKAAPAKVERTAPVPGPGDTVVGPPPDVRTVPDYAGRQIPHPDRLQREMTHGQMIGKPELISNNGEREEYRAKIMVEGKETEVILRAFNNRDAVEQTRKEVAVYELNNLLGLDAKYGATSIREFEVNGEKKLGSVRIAEHGKNLESELRQMAEKKYGNASDESVKKLIENDPKLKSAMEKAFAERTVLGEKNFQVKDFVINNVNGEYLVTSKSMEGSFTSNGQPEVQLQPGDTLSAQVQSVFADKPISKEVREKLNNFLETYNTEAGYAELKERGLTRREIQLIMARAEELTDKGTLPKPTTAVVGEALKLSDSNKNSLRVAKGMIHPNTELTTKEEVATHLDKVLENFKQQKRMGEAVRQEFEALVKEYKAGNPKAMQAVNKELGLNIELPKPAADADSSVKNLERAAVAPEQRAGYSTEKVLENGAIRNLLVESGIKEERARELEKELTSKDKETQRRAAMEIDKAYEKRGGYKAFVTEARGRLGAAAVVAGAVIPQLIESDKK